MTNGSAALSRQHTESWNLALKWVTALAAHFRVELSEPEIRIYCDSLKNENSERLSVAMKRCLNECDFMPRLADIRERMPAVLSDPKVGDFVPISNHLEKYSETHDLRVWVNAEGYKRVKIVPKVKLG